MKQTDGIINRAAMIERLPPVARAAMNRATHLPRNESSTAPVIEIYDFIGIDLWSGEGVTDKDIARQLKAIGNVPAITVRVNSGGGDAFMAMGILNQLRQHPATITVEVLGLAASAASVIAMAGRRVAIADGALMMIHNANILVGGDAADLEQMAAVLRKVDSEIAGTYAAKTGRPQSVFRDMMNAETWLNAAESVAAKLADYVLPEARANHRPPQSELSRRLADLQGDSADAQVAAARRRVAARN